MASDAATRWLARAVAIVIALPTSARAEPPAGDVPVQRPTTVPAPTEAEATSSPAPESAQAPTPEPAPAATPAPAPPPAPTEATIYVHLEAIQRGHALELFEVTEETGAGTSYRRACAEPCDVAVPARAEYFVRSGKNTDSRKFAVDTHGDSVVVHARPGSRAAGIAGEVLTAVGAILLVGGIGMIVAGELLDRHHLTLAGGGMLGGGLGSLAIGIPVELVAGHARVREVVRAR